MIPFLNLPVKIVKLFTSNVSESEIAAGVCLALFMGLIPLNGPMAVLLFVLFFLFKINRLISILVLPLIKIFYIAGLYRVADLAGDLLLIKADFLAPLWNILTGLPVVAYLDLGNTLVTGGLVVSAILSFPVYIGAKTGVRAMREKYFDKIKDSKVVKWFKNIPIIGKLVSAVLKVVSPVE